MTARSWARTRGPPTTSATTLTSRGTFCFPRLRAPNAPSAEAYAEALRERAGLMLMPSSRFLCADDRLRVCFGRDLEGVGISCSGA